MPRTGAGASDLGPGSAGDARVIGDHAPERAVVAASAVVTGGGMDFSDSLPGTAVREVKEETGLDVEITGLVGTYSDPRHISEYSDGEVRRQFNVCFTARVTGGTVATSDESTEIRFVAPSDLGALPMHHTQRLRIQHYVERRPTPYLG
ncbi:NUDIX domain-containing protein [Streptomyces sp. NBC_01214]|uniref:NUDIX hydrolase n=1 Tax=Streptomyces sp. NBC_01214 TaxID=2903777 RepID=UPI0022541780|nr:NUDIX domain-containing protein [Streptomyces sp. NBC_01214]MCX4805667.1 NUDIX domain-containing protein [Streptomyces sp. NBC_01214]